MPVPFVRNNIRLQLIAPVAVALILAIIGAMSIIIYTQNQSNAKLNRMISEAFSRASEHNNQEMTALSTAMDGQLATMNASARQVLTASTRDALQLANDTMIRRLESVREESANNLALLLGQIGKSAVVMEDYSTLSSYVQQIHQNPEVVFAFYLDANKAALTRYVNEANPKLTALLPDTGRFDPKDVIRNAMGKEGLLLVSQPIMVGDDSIGMVFICMDTSRTEQDAKMLEQQFNDLIDKNEAAIGTILTDESRGLIESLNRTVDQIKTKTVQAGETTVEGLTAANAELASHTKLLLLVGLSAAFAVVLVILFLNARSILRMLGGEPSTMTAMARRIAQGDLSMETGQQTASNKDSLQASLLDMVANLQNLIGTLLSESKRMKDTSKDLQKASREMTTDSEQSAEKAATVAAATEEMSSNMHSVSLASEQAAANVGVVASALEEMTAAIAEIAGNTERANSITREAVNYAETSSNKVNTLGQAAREISKVTEVITEISEQTNLLALNATIEAARAGEAGKGFAVVANEIKELARQTAEATGEIKARIQSIQDSTDDTVTEIAKISGVINDVNEIVGSIASAIEQQSATTADIAGNVTEAAQGIAEVNENVVQSSAVAGEIARDIAEVSRLATNSRQCSVRVEVSAELLGSVVQELSAETGRFNLGDSAAARRLKGASRERSQDEILPWSDSLATGIRKIDEQHRRLVDLVNQLYRAMVRKSPKAETGRILGELIEYTSTHFAAEEELFDQHGYPERDAHKKVHRDLVAKVLDFQNQFASGADLELPLLQFLKDWLVDHIIKTDKRYVPFLKGKGVA